MEQKHKSGLTHLADHPIFIGRQTALDEARPSPPFMVHTENFFYVGVRYAPEAARRALPEGLDPLDDASGVVGVYTAPEGWGLAPLRGTFFGVSVRDPIAPDGSPSVFNAEQVINGPGNPILRENYNRRVRQGVTQTWLNAGRAYGEMRSDDGLELTVEGEPDFEQTLAPTSGLHYYLGEAKAGGLNIFSVAFTARFTPMKLTRFEIGPAATPQMQALRPLEVMWAMFVDKAPLTFSAPSPFVTGSREVFSAKAQQIGLMDLFARIGHAAALVSREGRTLFLTPEAQSLLETARVGGKFAVWRRRDQKALDNAVATLLTKQSLVSESIAIERPNNALPIVARALPVSGQIAGEPAILFLFSDPGNTTSPSSESLLQILGLTLAEARLAAQIGVGHSARQSAEHLGITENTARSTLKIVYNKLGIRKQSELAGIVARLG